MLKGAVYTLKKPISIKQIWGIVLMCLGVAYIVSGVFNRVSWVQLNTQSSNHFEVIILPIGLLCLFYGILLIVLPIYFYHLKKKLLDNGVPIEGTVTKVKYLSYTQFGTQSPYRVYYTYNYKGRQCKGKSRLLWSKPECEVNDIITIYVHTEKNHYTLPIIVPQVLHNTSSRRTFNEMD